jgi:hypothetical protein
MLILSKHLLSRTIEFMDKEVCHHCDVAVPTTAHGKTAPTTVIEGVRPRDRVAAGML